MYLLKSHPGWHSQPLTLNSVASELCCPSLQLLFPCITSCLGYMASLPCGLLPHPGLLAPSSFLLLVPLPLDQFSPVQSRLFPVLLAVLSLRSTTNLLLSPYLGASGPHLFFSYSEVESGGFLSFTDFTQQIFTG